MTFVYRQRSRTDLFMLGFYHKRNQQRFFSATSWQTGLIPCALHTCEQVFTHLTYIGFPENETVELRKWVDDVQFYICRGSSTPFAIWKAGHFSPRTCVLLRVVKGTVLSFDPQSSVAGGL